MDKYEYIEIRVNNKEKRLKPDQIDIKDVITIIDNIETLLFPTQEEKKVRPLISYEIKNGSVKHIFFVPLLTVINFNGIIKEIKESNTIEFLKLEQQKAIYVFQHKAKQENLIFEFSNSKYKNDGVFKIDQNTNYKVVIPEVTTYDSEFYIYGTIILQGGKQPYITIETEDEGTINIKATRTQILEGENKLYQQWGLKVKGKKNISNNKPTEMTLVEFIGKYDPVFNQKKFNLMLERSKENMNEIKNIDQFIKDVRGTLYE